MITIKKEDIHGNMATVYHRTSASNLINSVYTEGFKPGNGAMYGRGFYSTYLLSSQEKPNMANSYGDIVVKFAVQVRDFFFFDFDEFRKVSLYKTLRSTPDTFIQDQIDYYKISPKIPFNPDASYGYTSEIALWLYTNSDLDRKVKGIVFTGARDGAVVVSYDPDLIYPLAYRIDGQKEFEKVEKNKDYLKKVLQKKLQVFEPEDVRNFYSKVLPFEKNKSLIKDGMKFYKIKDTSNIYNSYIEDKLLKVLGGSCCV